MTSNMHKKRFLNRQIFVTSVVSQSPTKPDIQTQTEKTPASKFNLPPNLGNPLLLKPLPATQTPDQASPTSPGVQDKIDQIEKQTSSTLNPESRVDKRKSECSPESDEMSRKEKKMLREEERKQDKMRKKLEYKAKNTIQCEVNHSF